MLQATTAAWYPQTADTHDGIAAMRSFPIIHNESSEMGTTVTGPGLLTSWWSVSSEDSADFLLFELDGVAQAQISGGVDWQEQAIFIPDGPHTVNWVYLKNEFDDEFFVSTGSDTGWVDQVKLEREFF